MKFSRLKLLWVLLLCLPGLGAIAQAQDSTGFMEKLRAFGKKEAENSVDKFRNGRIGIRQEKLLQELRQTSERAKIDEMFRQEGIVVPFPQRDVHIIKPKEQPGNEE